MPPKSAPKAKAAAGDHASYQDMITDAIVTLKERNGSSRAALKKYVKANNKITTGDAMFTSLFNRAIGTGVKKGVFAQPKGASGGVKLAKKEPKPAAAKPKTEKKVTEKKPVVKKATTTKKVAAKPKPAAKPAAKKATTTKKAAAPKKEVKPKVVKKVAAKPKKAAAPKAAPAIVEKPAVLGKTKSGRVTKTTPKTPAAKKAAPKKAAAKKATPKKATPKKA